MKWYKMDCDSQANLDMRKLVAEWGWDWLGRYHALIGMVGMQVTERCTTFALHTNDGRPFPVQLLSHDLSTTVERLTNFLNYLADNHLIDKRAWKRKGLIYMPKLRDRADEYTKKLLRKSGQTPVQEGEEEEEGEQKKNISSLPREARPGSFEDVQTYFASLGYPQEAQPWLDRMTEIGWVVGKAKNPVKDWRASCRTWVNNERKWAHERKGTGIGRGRDSRASGSGQGATGKPRTNYANARGTVVPIHGPLFGQGPAGSDRGTDADSAPVPRERSAES